MKIFSILLIIGLIVFMAFIMVSLRLQSKHDELERKYIEDKKQNDDEFIE